MAFVNPWSPLSGGSIAPLFVTQGHIRPCQVARSLQGEAFARVVCIYAGKRPLSPSHSLKRLLVQSKGVLSFLPLRKKPPLLLPYGLRCRRRRSSRPAFLRDTDRGGKTKRPFVPCLVFPLLKARGEKLRALFGKEGREASKRPKGRLGNAHVLRKSDTSQTNLIVFYKACKPSLIIKL